MAFGPQCRTTDVPAQPGQELIAREKHAALGQVGRIGDQQLIDGGFGIEFHLHDFRVTGRSGADRLVIGIDNMTAGIAGHNPRHAPQFLEDRFKAPEAAPAQGRDFLAHVCSPLIGPVAA